MGPDKGGDYIGYDNGTYFKSVAPLDSFDNTLKVGEVAVDLTVVHAGSNLTVPSLPSPWGGMTFFAGDSGPDITGKHVDVYTGMGKSALASALLITGYGNTVCVLNS